VQLYINQFNSPQRPGDPRCGSRCASGQHVRLETTLSLPSPKPPMSPGSTPPPPAVPPPALAVPPPALAPIAGHQHQIRMLPVELSVELPPRPTAAATGRARVRQQQQQQPERHLMHASKPVSASTTRYRHGLPYYPEAELFFNPFDAAARARSRSPPASPLPRPCSTPSPPTLHFPSSPLAGPTSPPSSNDTGNAASPNSSSSSSSERNLNPLDTAETGLTDGENCAAPIWSQAEWDEATTPSPPAAGNWDVTPIPSSPDESVVPQRQNLNSHGTHSVPAQVIARLYSSHFSTRENVAAESQKSPSSTIGISRMRGTRCRRTPSLTLLP
jgi:hypothetical protein